MSDRTGVFNIYKQALGQSVPDLVVAGSRQTATPVPRRQTTSLRDLSELGRFKPRSPADASSRWSEGAPQEIAKANFINNHQCSRAPATLCIYSVTEHDITFFTFDPLQGPIAQVYQIKDDLTELYNWTLSPDGTTLAIAKGKWGDAEARIHLVRLTAARNDGSTS